MPPATPPQEELTCISIIIADCIYQDAASGKKIIVGTFSDVNLREVPAVHGPIAFLFTLTNGNGTYNLSLAVEHEATGNLVLSMDGPATILDPLEIADIQVGISKVLFPETGKYWVVVRSDGKIIQQRPFRVRLIENRQVTSDE